MFIFLGIKYRLKSYKTLFEKNRLEELQITRPQIRMQKETEKNRHTYFFPIQMQHIANLVVNLHLEVNKSV